VPSADFSPRRVGVCDIPALAISPRWSSHPPSTTRSASNGPAIWEPGPGAVSKIRRTPREVALRIRATGGRAQGEHTQPESESILAEPDDNLLGVYIANSRMKERPSARFRNSHRCRWLRAPESWAFLTIPSPRPALKRSHLPHPR
jgi:hypothetical protein